MKNLQDLTLQELISMGEDKKTSPDTKTAISLEMERRQTIATEQDQQRRLAKELKMQEARLVAEESQARQIAQREEHERFLLTEEGRQWAENERVRAENERAELEAARIAREEREAIEAKERYEREAQAEAERKQKEIDELEHQEQLQEEYSPEDILKIKERERILQRKLKPSEIPYKSKAHQRCAEVDVIDSRNHPDYGTIERYYSRHLTTPANQQDLYLRTFMHKFKEKFRSQNNNQLANHNTNNTFPLASPGSNNHDVTITHIKEATQILGVAKGFYDAAFEKSNKVNELLLSLVADERANSKALAKRILKNEERLETAKENKGKTEIKLLKLRKNYLKKHPVVAGLENAGKAVEQVGNAVIKLFATPEEKEKLEKEEAAQKARKKLAKDEAQQEAIAEAVKAELRRRGIKD